MQNLHQPKLPLPILTKQKPSQRNLSPQIMSAGSTVQRWKIGKQRATLAHQRWLFTLSAALQTLHSTCFVCPYNCALQKCENRYGRGVKWRRSWKVVWVIEFVVRFAFLILVQFFLGTSSLQLFASMKPCHMEVQCCSLSCKYSSISTWITFQQIDIHYIHLPISCIRIISLNGVFTLRSYKAPVFERSKL